MGHDEPYLHLGRLARENKMEKGLLKIILDTSGMTIKEKINHNLDPEIWAYRIQYLKYSIKNAVDYFRK